jgi:hypothetical protein
MAKPAVYAGPGLRPGFALLLILARPCLALSCAGGGPPEPPARQATAGDPGSAPGPHPGAGSRAPGLRAPVTVRFQLTTRGPERDLPVYATFTGRDDQGRFCHLDRDGRFLPCSPADNVLPRDGRTWCDYAIPIHAVPRLDLARGLKVDSGRIYLSVGEPVLLRVDEATLGLVQPDPGNPSDPNRQILYDWVELALDGTGFHGNTTCVDQFGLPVALTVVDRGDPGHPLGPVGIRETRAALFAAWRAGVPPAFLELADPGDRRILAPAHGPFGPDGLQADYLQPYIDAMWQKNRNETLVLTPDEGTFTGRVDGAGRMVFTRNGDPTSYVITRRPTSAETFRCDGVLAAGGALEKVLGAQLAALLNRHLLERPLDWRDAAAYYRQEPGNHYARFWHEHSLDGKAYGFAYDDVADQSASLAAADPREIIVSFGWD